MFTQEMLLCCKVFAVFSVMRARKAKRCSVHINTPSLLELNTTSLAQFKAPYLI